MTVILVDKANPDRDLQLANRIWDCIVSNLELENVLKPETTEFLRINSVGTLDAVDALKLAKALREIFIPRLADSEVLFLGGQVGEVTTTGKGFSLDTPYHLVSHVSKETLETLHNFVSQSKGFDVL